MGDFRSKKLQFFAADRAAWRRWLAKNHAKRDEVFLVFVKKSTGRACLSYDEAVREALCFGWIDGIKNTIDDERYCYRFTPRRPGSAWSPSNKKRVAELIAEGTMKPPGLKQVEAAKKSGAWDKPARPATPEKIPPELAAAFHAAKKAKQFFDTLAPGQKRQWMMWVADAKKAETRERRAAKAIEKLTAGEKYP